jgi:hypothetical protein
MDVNITVGIADRMGKWRVNLGRGQDGDVPAACDIGEDLIVVGGEELGYS